MKNFFKTFGAALLAFFVGTVLMWFVLFSIIGLPPPSDSGRCMFLRMPSSWWIFVPE